MADGAARLDLGQLVADHHAVLFRYAYRLSGSTSDAEDLTQQTFLAAHEKLAQLRDAGSARSWLFAILRNSYLKSCRQRTPLGAVAEIDVASLADASAERAIDEAIDSEHLQAAINGLADEFKTVVLMFYFEHSSYREIAEALAVPPGTVMSRLARAKAHLRRALSEPAPNVQKSAAPCGLLVVGNGSSSDRATSVRAPSENGISDRGSPAASRPL